MLYKVGIAFLFACVSFSVLFGLQGLEHATIDVQMHNTYFVFPTYIVLLLLFFVWLLLLLAIDFFRTRVGNLPLMMTAGVCSLICSGILILLSHVGWTIYPPLYVEAKGIPTMLTNPLEFVIRGAWCLQLFFQVLTIWAAILLGKAAR